MNLKTDMFFFAAAKLGILHEVLELQNVPTVHQMISSSIIHYPVEVPLKNGHLNLQIISP